jgi:hypothetical protein
MATNNDNETVETLQLKLRIAEKQLLIEQEKTTEVSPCAVRARTSPSVRVTERLARHAHQSAYGCA